MLEIRLKNEKAKVPDHASHDLSAAALIGTLQTIDLHHVTRHSDCVTAPYWRESRAGVRSKWQVFHHCRSGSQRNIR